MLRSSREGCQISVVTSRRPMASQPDTLDYAQLRSVVAWLEEQRKADREETGRLAAEVERLTAGLREQAATVEHLRGELAAERAGGERVPLIDEAVRQLREQIGHLSGRVDDHAQQTATTLQVRAADAERDRRQLADVTQLASQLERDAQATAARMKAVAEELRRGGTQLADLPRQLGEADGRIGALSHRFAQIDEQVRRLDGLGSAMKQEMELVRTENAKVGHWQQLADLRWTRHLAEWQQTVDNWRQTAEEQAKPVQQLLVQLGQHREELRALQGVLGEQQRRVDEFGASLTRVESAAAQQREGLTRLEQVMEAQRRRFDEQASAQLRLDDALGRGSDQAHHLELSLEEQGRLVEEARGGLRALEAALAQLRDEVAARLASTRAELDGDVAKLGEHVDALREGAHRAENGVREFARAAREHRQRLGIELERQANELGELLGRDPGG
jgi:chromosome segregation ATPase